MQKQIETGSFIISLQFWIPSWGSLYTIFLAKEIEKVEFEKVGFKRVEKVELEKTGNWKIGILNGIVQWNFN